MTKRIMRSFKMSEISGVDRPAQEHAKAVIIKRDDSLSAKIAASESADDLMALFDDACARLGKSIETIIADEACVDKQEAVGAALAEFNKSFGAAEDKEDTTMTDKALAEAQAEIAKRDADLAKLTSELAVLKMSEKHRAFADLKKMSTEDLAAFAAKSAEDRDAIIGKTEADPEIAKRDAEIAKRDAELAEVKKQVAALNADKDRAVFAKQAVDMGLPEAKGEMLMKAHGGDVEAIKELAALVKGLNEQVRTGKVFEEFGTAHSGDTTSAVAKVASKVAELRKSDPTLNDDTAKAQIAKDPSQRELWEAFKAEGARRA